eukprot:scaffold87493_cov25-Tisochrysis_lutea.AAC.10
MEQSETQGAEARVKGLFIGPAQVHGYHAADLSPGPQAKLAAGGCCIRMAHGNRPAIHCPHLTEFLCG